MISNLQMQYALRTQLLTMEAATTGAISMAATSDGFTRSSGSFLDDGFAPGMEVTATGFGQPANNDDWVVEQVEALTVHVTGLTAEGADGGRTLSAGLPSNRAWENIDFEPTPREPYVEEQFPSGPSSQITNGTGNATVQVDPLYVVNVFTPENLGMEAPNRYADAILQTFRPNRSFNLSNGDALRVRTDVGPLRGQLIRRKPGWVVVPVTIALRLFTTNS